jgi:hypothetical protein
MFDFDSFIKQLFLVPIGKPRYHFFPNVVVFTEVFEFEILTK